MSKEWLWQTATDLGRAIEAGMINAVDLTETYLEAIATHPQSQRIYARVMADQAIKAAKAAHERAKAGLRWSPLDGVPISWKDLYDTAGVGTEAGSLLLKDRVPKLDAEVYKNAAAAGLICLGKTHMSELAFSGLGYNPSTETPPCVNDLDCVAGGSSSGAAASVAFGLAAAAIGSDTGGSVRIPAAWNDLVGLKTTSGRLSLAGVVPLCAHFDTVGPLCRSVEDAAHLLAALESGKTIDLAKQDLSKKRFAVLTTIAQDDLRSAPKASFQVVLEQLQTLGAMVDEIEIPEIAEAMALTAVLYTTEAYAQWQRVIEANPTLMFDEILMRFRAGARFSAVEYIQAWQKLTELRQVYHAKTAVYDAVLMPTSPILPPNIEHLASNHKYYITENLYALRNTRIGNLMDCAVLTLPTGVKSTGISLMTPPMSEVKLLGLGRSVEFALGE